jgi:hypothetical protein
MDMTPRYLTFAEYQMVGGTLSEAEFNYYAYEAESYIDWYTFNRLHNNTNIPDAVKRCEVYLIKFIQERLSAFGISVDNSEVSSSGDILKSIMSQSNDGVSVSYNSLAARDATSLLSQEIGQTIQRYLQGVTNELGRKLLYRGLYPGE